MAVRPARSRRKFLAMAAGASVLLLVGALAGAVVLLSGAMTTAATAQHYWLTYRILDWGLHFSVRRHAEGIRVPDLTREERIVEGHACYRSHCEQCHGSVGIAPAAVALGLLPGPGNLSQAGRDWPPERLYYVIRKGIRMTGMPAWEYRLSDHSLWSTVAFMKQMPFMSRGDVADLNARAATVPCERAAAASGRDFAEPLPVVMRQYACDSCHRIQGVVGPVTHVGPPLEQWSRRKYIAGVLPNTRENLVLWIRDPASISPATMMPNLGVSEQLAEAMAAFLMSQK
jgi:mono/diheme cytochrome c family protein/cytochrome c551/c552